MKTTASARKSYPIQQTGTFNQHSTGSATHRSNDDTPASFYFLLVMLGIALVGAVIYGIIA